MAQRTCMTSYQIVIFQRVLKQRKCTTTRDQDCSTRLKTYSSFDESRKGRCAYCLLRGQNRRGRPASIFEVRNIFAIILKIVNIIYLYEAHTGLDLLIKKPVLIYLQDIENLL